MSEAVQPPQSQQSPPAIPGYNHLRYLGSGCWGQVHLYQQGSTGALYACKFFDPDSIAQSQMTERGWTEGDVWKKECLGGNTRSLPGLAYGSLEELPDGRRYFRREYVDRLLSDAMAEKKLSLDDLVLVARGIAVGLESIHLQLHRVYGDLKPENVAFTTQNDVKLMDFGAATVGESPRKYGGELFTRAPERFGNDSQVLRHSSDVWGAGAILYYMFTGKYPLNHELHDAHHPEEIVRALYSSSSSWNERIAEKVDHSVPRAFRKLLYKSLCHESERLKDGKAFSQELEQAVRKYHRSTPRARFIQAIAGLTALSIIGVTGTYLYYLHNDLDDLQQQKASVEKALSLEKKIHIVRLHMAGVRYPSDFNELSETGKLQGWIDIFGDRSTAVAAYFDKDLVARAILESGGKSDFKSIDDILFRLDPTITGAVYGATSNAVDGWAWRLQGDSKKEIIREWKKAENDLTDRCNALVAEYRKLQQEIDKNAVEGINAGPVVGDIAATRRMEAERKQGGVLETLVSLTGKSFITLEEQVDDPSFTFSMPLLQSAPESGSPQSE